MRVLKAMLIGVVVLIAALVAFAYSGVYDVAADEPHWGGTAWLIETMRERSIAARAQSVGKPPRLDDPALLATGAEHYAEMCTGCHLAPGMEDTEMRAGLYPKPPNLAAPDDTREPGETFWIIKHGLKMTGMPAWGVTHDDRKIWAMTAFVLQLPGLTPAKYEDMVGPEPASGHSHGDEEPAGHSHAPDDGHTH